MPMLLEHFALNTRLAYNHLIEQGQKMMILMKGQMMQCALTELNAIQEQSLAWASAYGQCKTTEAPETTSTTSSSFY